ncbi:RNA-binding protein Nova-1 [Fasciola hepatica]|uniref:RNA-binding protein Nova-1 n=1 Tax=Fasciola hepatica TaxID=6192 RepID=A0A4E0RFA6_FASHE|nr:RNA-binding protein Nova-1 [Fasciola hepatica]
MSVHNYIMDRIMEKPDPNPHATGEGRLNVERHKQVKILVPNSTAGMVIGKGGSYIQEIKDKTGAYVQISQKSREFNLFERCIIIAGDLDQTRAAVQLILAVIAADPQSASCPNLSYHDVRGPVASVYPTGSPYATPMIPCPATPNWMTAGGSPVDPTTASAAAAMMAAMFSPGTVPTVGSAPGTRSSTFGFFSTNYSSSPDFTSLAVLASNQHALGLTPMLQPIALPSPGANAATTPVDLVGAPGTPYGSSPTQPAGFAGAGTLDPGSVMTARQAALLASIGSKPQLVPQDMPQLTDTMPHSAFISQSAMLPRKRSVAVSRLFSRMWSVLTVHLSHSTKIEVPESVIGLILGPQGRSIIDLQSSTGTIIQISQKGVYLTGTQNRLVTITGAQANVQWAADVIEQRLQAERIRRESTTSNQTTPPPPTAATTGPSAGSNQSDIERQRTLSLFYQQQTSSGLYADSQLSVSSSIPISATSGVSCLSAGMTAVPAPAGESTIVQPQSQNPTTSLHSAKRDSDTHGFRQAS